MAILRDVFIFFEIGGVPWADIDFAITMNLPGWRYGQGAFLGNDVVMARYICVSDWTVFACRSVNVHSRAAAARSNTAPTCAQDVAKACQLTITGQGKLSSTLQTTGCLILPLVCDGYSMLALPLPVITGNAGPWNRA